MSQILNRNQVLAPHPSPCYEDPMCHTCKGLAARVSGLEKRITRQTIWTSFQDQLRRGAYRNLLRSIMKHMYESGHEVDSLTVMLALGKRARLP